MTLRQRRFERDRVRTLPALEIGRFEAQAKRFEARGVEEGEVEEERPGDVSMPAAAKWFTVLSLGIV